MIWGVMTQGSGKDAIEQVAQAAVDAFERRFGLRAEVVEVNRAHAGKVRMDGRDVRFVANVATNCALAGRQKDGVQ